MKDNNKKPTAAGKSSFDLIDVDKFFKELDLQKGIALDYHLIRLMTCSPPLVLCRNVS